MNNSESTCSLETEWKYKQFKRVLISYIDFQTVVDIVDLILSEEMVKNYRSDNRYRLQGLCHSAIVSYSRPFSGNKGIPDLPKRFINQMSDEQKEFHDRIFNLRNEIVAHSDSGSWNMEPVYIPISGEKVLMPLHDPLEEEDIIFLGKTASFQMEQCMEEREKMENELSHLIPDAVLV